MGRMHTPGKGIAASALPYKRSPPAWLKVSAKEVEAQVAKFAKKGLSPSQIGVILRDSHAIAQVKSVTGNKILRLLKKAGALRGLCVQRVSCVLSFREHATVWPVCCRGPRRGRAVPVCACSFHV